MRLSTFEGDAGFVPRDERHGVTVRFNGEEIQGVLMADDVTGEIVQVLRDADGQLVIDESGERFKTTNRFGRVEIIREARQLPQAATPSDYREAMPDTFCDAFCTWRGHHAECPRNVLPVPLAAIGQLLSEAMAQCVENGANSVSMPDHIVEIAAFLSRQ